ncbi:MAG: hypothetical protein HDR12_11000 [Lachnospiraceae bacterium]|nr:hypothetical protein [Lachnospiraceae bacterium]
MEDINEITSITIDGTRCRWDVDNKGKICIVGRIIMEDLTIEMKIVTQKIHYIHPITEQDWSNVKCTLFMDRDRKLYFVGHIRGEDYPVYVIKATIDECADKEKLLQIKNVADEYCEKRMIYHSKGSGVYDIIHNGTYGLVYNNKITLGTLNGFPYDYYPIRQLIKDAETNAKFYSEIIDWQAFSDKMDKLDELTKNFIYGRDCYPSLLEFHHFAMTNFTFMALSDDDFARKQYERFIAHLDNEFQARSALR